MGHRSYLYISKKESTFYAFEANNSIPFFWLTLIDSKTLKDKTSDWKDFEKHSDNHTESEFEEYMINKSFVFKINFDKFQKNSSNGTYFIKNHFPEIAALYNDFIETLKTHFKNDEILEIEIDEISAFYDSLDEYTKVLSEEINAIEGNKPENIRFLSLHDLIASGTGFESLNLKSFSKLPSYIEAYKNRRAVPIKNKYVAPIPNKKSFILGVVMLLICPLFTFITYRGYIKDGLSFPVILIGVFNLLFYFYSFNGIISNINAFIKPRSIKT